MYKHEFFSENISYKSMENDEKYTATDGSDGVCMKIPIYLNIPF